MYTLYYLFNKSKLYYTSMSTYFYTNCHQHASIKLNKHLFTSQQHNMQTAQLPRYFLADSMIVLLTLCLP